MPCYHPIQAWRTKFNLSSGKPDIFFSNVGKYPQHLIEPIQLKCGQCIGCRLERSRQWAVRCVLEAKQHEENSFITLTYDDEHLPSALSSDSERIHSTLDKTDLQKFWKRLRKHLNGRKIRYFACGEYGEQFSRPHYHAILFGYKFEKELREVNGKPVWVAPELLDVWQQGLVSADEVSFESCAYVARYNLKKINGPGALEYYDGRQPEFVTMSRRPGIGKGFFDVYWQNIYGNDRIISRGVPVKPPPYFDRLLENVDKALLRVVKDKRSQNIPVYDELLRAELARKKAYAEYQQQKKNRNL